MPSWVVGARPAPAPVEEDVDAALVRRCRDGDANAYGHLVARHDKRVYALVARVLGPAATADDVDDVAQDVFVQAWRALPKFRQDSRFSTWLYRIAANMAIKEWHRIKRRASAVFEEDLPATVREALAESRRRATGRCGRQLTGCRRSRGRSSCCTISRTVPARTSARSWAAP